VVALEPEDRAVQEDVLAPCEVGVETSAELEERADAAADGDAPRGRLHDPREQAEQGRLARAVAPDEPDRAPGLDRERDAPERPDVAPAGVPAQEHEVLQRAPLARVDAEAPRRALDRDLAGDHPADGTERAPRTRLASTRIIPGSAFGISIRSRRIPSSPARACASVSRSQRISRWSATNPTGQTRTSRTPRASRSARWSRMSGPSHGSPVSDSLWKENDHSPGSRPARSATSREVSRSWPLYGSPSARIRSGSECAVKTTWLSVPRTRSARSSTKPSSSCQLSTNARSARPASASSSCCR